MSRKIKVLHTDGRVLGEEDPPLFAASEAGQYVSYKGNIYVIRSISGSTTQGPAAVVLADNP